MQVSLGVKAVLLLALLAAPARLETISDFEGGYFKFIKKDAQLYKLDVDIANPSDGNIVMAYGDFNSDS